ncbi:MAG: hypothetical protein WB586_06825 [Chthoniobacterales bacterium]
MKHFIRTTSLAIAGVAGVYGLGLLAINLYVQSAGTQLRIRQAVSESIGLPISVFRITFTPWGDFVFEDVTIGNPSAGVPLAKAERLTVACDFFPFFHRKVAIKQVALQHVEINIPIATPESFAELNNDIDQSDSDFGPAPAPTTSSPSALTPPAEPPAAPAPSAHRSLKFRIPLPHHFWAEIKKFKVVDGSIFLIGPDGSPAVTLRGVECFLHFQKGDYAGEVHAEAASLGDSLNLEDLRSPVKCTAGELDLEQIQGTLSGGEVQGSFHLDLAKPQFPYQFALQLLGVDINDITARTGGFLDRAHGTLKGSFQLAGLISDPSQNTGQGELEIKAGYLDQYPMLQEIGRWTQIDELRRLELEQAASHFRVVGPNIRVDSIRLSSKNCQINLWGTVEGARNLALTGRLTVTQFLSQKIPSELEENFVPSQDGRVRTLDFQVTGSILKPQTDLFERIIGDRRKLLKRFLRSERRDRPRPPEPSDSHSDVTPNNN